MRYPSPDKAPILKPYPEVPLADKSFQIRLVTPQGKLLDGRAIYASVPAHDGLMGFQPGRAPVVFKLGLGEMRVTFADERGVGGGTRNYVIEGGFGHMTADKLTVLTTRAVAGSDIVQEEAQKELTAAQASTSGNLAEMDQITRQRDRARLKVRVAQSGVGRGI